MSERVTCCSREDIVNSSFINTVEKELCHYLGHNLVLMVDEPWPKEQAKNKAYQVNRFRCLSGCEENFVYARVSVEGSKTDEKSMIERGLKQIVEKWIGCYGDHIRRKHSFMPYILLSQVDGLVRSNNTNKEADVTLVTVCMAAYIQ